MGVVGEMGITWSEDDFHNPIVERKDFVTFDEEINHPGWVLTKIIQQEEMIVDSHGHSINRLFVIPCFVRNMQEIFLSLVFLV